MHALFFAYVDDAAAVTEYTGSAAAVTVPSELGGYPVTEIGASAFYDCISLPSVTIPDSVTEVGNFAFSGCSDLASVTLSKSLETLGSSAFSGCKALTSIHIPKSLVSAGINIFYNTGLKQVSFADGVTQIPGSLFYGCGSLETIAIPDTVTQIGWGAFEDCTSLQSVTIPDSVTQIGGEAFYGCTSLQSVTIPDSVTQIGGDAFYGCTDLASVRLPRGLTRVTDSMFSGCESLTDITLPDGVTQISRSAFYGCASLASVALPEKLQTIGSSAFAECASLTELYVPAGVTSVGSSAFYNCDALRTAVVASSGAIGDRAFYDCDALTSLTLADSVTGIGSSLCYGCDSLSALTLSDQIETIPDSAFRLCAALQTVTLPRYCTTVAASAFAEDTKLMDVYIPAYVTKIENNSFSYPARTAVYGREGSYAQEYAAARGMAFHAIEQPITSLAYTDGSISLALRTGRPAALQIRPDFDTDDLTFTSDNEEIATVSETGEIYAKSYGTARITATAASGASASITVTVVRPATDVALPKEELPLTAGGAEQLTAALTPGNSTDTVEWASDNPAVAFVQQDGTVTAISPGSAVITAKAAYGSKQASCLVTVAAPDEGLVEVTGLTLTPAQQEMAPGSTLQLDAAVRPENATTKLLTWSSSNAYVASVTDGVVTAHAAGTAVITAKSVSGGFTAACSVTVVPPAEITALSVEDMGELGLVRLTAANIPAEAAVFVAAYDRAGRLVVFRQLTLANGTAQESIPLTDAAQIKAFIWEDGSLRPLAGCKAISVSQ